MTPACCSDFEPFQEPLKNRAGIDFDEGDSRSLLLSSSRSLVSARHLHNRPLYCHTHVRLAQKFLSLLLAVHLSRGWVRCIGTDELKASSRTLTFQIAQCCQPGSSGRSKLPLYLHCSSAMDVSSLGGGVPSESLPASCHQLGRADRLEQMLAHPLADSAPPLEF